MNDKDFLNTVYDVLAQNNVDPWERHHITELIDHVDTERNTITFINSKGKEFELRLVATFAPSTEVAKESTL